MAIDQEIKDFLDHMRTTCVEERQQLKLENRRLRESNRALAHDLNEAEGRLLDLGQPIPYRGVGPFLRDQEIPERGELAVKADGGPPPSDSRKLTRTSPPLGFDGSGGEG